MPAMNQSEIAQALKEIAKIDRDVKQAVKIIGLPTPRTQPAGFETLVQTIVAQQLSTKAADAIMQRVKKLLPDMTPNEVLRKRKQTLRNAGLSERKVEYIQGLAKSITQGTFNLKGLNKMRDQDAITEMTKLRGFGEWSAEIYLMFSLKRTDIFPANDLAIQVALQNLKNLDQRPTAKAARSLVENWAPWRSAGSLFLWHFYKHSTNKKNI